MKHKNTTKNTDEKEKEKKQWLLQSFFTLHTNAIKSNLWRTNRHRTNQVPYFWGLVLTTNLFEQSTETSWFFPVSQQPISCPSPQCKIQVQKPVWWYYQVVAITPALLKSTILELKFCACSNSASGPLICDGENLWQRLKIKLNAFRQLTIWKKRFITTIIEIFFFFFFF